jgi:hypothetical protein
MNQSSFEQMIKNMAEFAAPCEASGPAADLNPQIRLGEFRADPSSAIDSVTLGGRTVELVQVERVCPKGPLYPSHMSVEVVAMLISRKEYARLVAISDQVKALAKLSEAG